MLKRQYQNLDFIKEKRKYKFEMIKSYITSLN